MSQPTPDAQSGTDTGQGAGTDQGQGTGTPEQTGQSTGAATETGKPAGEETVSRTEFEQLRNQLRAADQKRSEAEKALKDLVEKDLPAQEKLNKELEEAKAERDRALVALKETRLRAAFLESNKYKWKNPATALKLADLTNVEVDDDGTVRGLTAALDALAKSDAYLVETDESSKDGPKGSTGASSTGGQPGSANTSLKALASRVPALRTRGIGGTGN